MRDQLRSTNWRYCFLFVFLCSSKLYPQCTPRQAETCEESLVLCSLDEVNGYSCNTSLQGFNPCSPICSQGGMGYYSSWWGFVTQGGSVTITFTVGDCKFFTTGLQFGIWGDCTCGEEIICRSVPCIAPKSVSVVTANLTPCKLYYLWVNGCQGNICDFTLNTNGGAPPELKPLSFINNDTDKVISICKGQKNAKFFLEPQIGGCEPSYVWSLDNKKLATQINEVSLDFPDTGKFVICVSAFIGNLSSGSICAQQGPQCATIEVRLPKIINNQLRWVCPEIVANGSGQDANCIYNSDGTYRCEFLDSSCIIETGHYVVSAVPTSPDVYYIACDNTPYKDIFGKTYVPCKDHYQLKLQKSTDRFHCDSTIQLTAVKVDFLPLWRIACIGGQVEISPNVRILKPCSVGESYEFNYRWYRKSDGKTVSTDEQLVVASVNVDYCLEVSVKVDLETEHAICVKTFCESFNEGDLAPKILPIDGDRICCINGLGKYWLDTFISWKMAPNFKWSIVGGSFLSKTDSFGVLVKWNLSSADTGMVCFNYDTDCGAAPEVCITVIFTNESAGKDFKQKGLIAKLNSQSIKSGNWKLISGPAKVFFENLSNPKTRVRADQYGVYCFEWLSSNCTTGDTVCIEFYKIKSTDPTTPKKDFEDRLEANDSYFIELFTPNLLASGSNSFLLFSRPENELITYTWFDLQGKMISKNSILSLGGFSKEEIITPNSPGLYILVIESDGIRELRKVCVM